MMKKLLSVIPFLVTSLLLSQEPADKRSSVAADFRYRLGRSYLNQGKLREAEMELKRVLQINPDHVGARYFLGRTYHRGGNLTGAVAEFERAVELLESRTEESDADIGLSEAYLQMAVVKSDLEKWDEAMAFIEKAHASETEPEAKLYYRKGYIHRGRGELDKALDAFLEAYRMRPDHPRICTDLGALLVELGEYDRGLEILEGCLKLDPRDEEAHRAASEAFRRRGDEKRALEEKYEYERLKAEKERRRRVRDETKGILERSFHLSRTARYGEALRVLKGGMVKDRENGAVYSEMGRIYFRLKDLDKAEKYYKKAISLEPDLFPPQLEYALLLLQEGRLYEAFDRVKRAEEIDPFSWKVYHVEAEIYVRLGRANDAITELEKAIALNPQKPEVRELLAEIYMGVGRRDEARREMSIAAELRQREGGR